MSTMGGPSRSGPSGPWCWTPPTLSTPSGSSAGLRHRPSCRRRPGSTSPNRTCSTQRILDQPVSQRLTASGMGSPRSEQRSMVLDVGLMVGRVGAGLEGGEDPGMVTAPCGLRRPCPPRQANPHDPQAAVLEHSGRRSGGLWRGEWWLSQNPRFCKQRPDDLGSGFQPGPRRSLDMPDW